MTLPLLRKRYNFHIISFILLSSLFGGVSNATPACPIVTNQFQGANGTTVDTGVTGWSIDASALTAPHPTGYYFALKSNRFTATNLGGVGIVNSHVFSIAGYKSPQVSVKITAEGQQNSTEYIQFYYKLDGGAPVLVAQQNGNFGTLTFTSPVLSGNNVQLIIKIYDYNNGSGQNSNYYIERYDVFQTSGPCTPGTASISVSATASNSGAITCSNSSVTLSASSTTTGLSYFWTGPNSYSSTSTSPSVSTAGTYTVIVTTSTGWGTATVNVTTNTTAPAGVTATVSGFLSCATAGVTLTGSSTTSGATFTWTGPNSFTATGATATASTAGTYTVTARNPTTGCTATASVAVTSNATAPANVMAISSGSLSCSTTSVTLTGSSSTSGITFAWTGPNGFTATGATAAVSTPGTYTVTATNPTNGCTASANTIIAQNTAAPAGLAIASLPATPLLTCTNTNVSLTASSALSGASYTWVGPNNFTSSAATINISAPGIYTVTAINTANGCASSLAANILQNIAPPANLSTVSNPLNATLTCSTNSIALTASSAVTGANYSWTGPNSFAGAAATATVTSPGTYTVTATDTSNGCTSTASAIIAQNITAPVGLKSTANPASGQITCTHPNVVLTGSATTTGVNYSWTGPDSYTASGAAATIIAPGVYTVTATDPTNGCTSTATGTVTRNTNAPIGVTAGTSDVISCFTPSVFVTGSTTTPGATFSWTGPDGFTASTDNAEADEPGTYTLIVTNPANGCTTTAITIVEDNTAPPAGVTATNSGPLNCINTSVTLTGSSTTAGVTYTWVAPDNSLIQGATTSVTIAGTYTLVATDPDNGCASTATTAVAQNTTGCTGSLAQVRNAMSGAGATLGSDTTQGLAGVTAFEYKTYPNPFSDQAFIEFKSPESALVTVEIYNNLGVRKKILFNSTVIAHQSYKLELDKGNLSSGTYFCIIRTSNKIYTAKLILVSR